jgi:3-methylcrotonyl-CoA carboxylase alpha subunit
MNTRLQVEHPVTEAVTGLDLVEWQFRIAAGEPLPLTQDQVPLQGHAVEARVYAEDAERSFLPSTGKLIALQFPAEDGLRIDAGVEAGSAVTPFYDPMLAKLIAHCATRDQALDRLADALEKTIAVGPRSNLGFLVALARAPAFRGGDFDTGFIDAHLVELGAAPQALDCAGVALAAQKLLARERARIDASIEHEPDQLASPWEAADAYQLAGTRRLVLPLIADGESVMAEITYGTRGPLVTVDGVEAAADAFTLTAAEAVYVLRHGRQIKVSLRDIALDEAGDREHSGLVRAPMHGKVLAVLVEPGAPVKRGQRLAIIEAMKMEHTLTAPIDGVVAEIGAVQDAQVTEGARIMLIAPTKPQPYGRGRRREGCLLLFMCAVTGLVRVLLHAEIKRQRPTRQHQRQPALHQLPALLILLHGLLDGQFLRLGSGRRGGEGCNDHE